VVRETKVEIDIDKARVVASLPEAAASRLLFSKSRKLLTVTERWQVLGRGNEARIVAPLGDSASCKAPIDSLVKLVARVHDWYEKIVSGGFWDNRADRRGFKPK
jgi:hypothetical protein